MTIELTYEARRKGLYEGRFELEPEEETKYLSMTDSDERKNYLRALASEHADMEDEWDFYTETDVWMVTLDDEEIHP